MRESPSHRYQKLPVTIKAMRLPPELEDPSEELIEFLMGVPQGSSERDGAFAIETLEGTMMAKPGDWIICGVNGEYYPCDHDIFVKSYRPVEDTF